MLAVCDDNDNVVVNNSHLLDVIPQSVLSTVSGGLTLVGKDIVSVCEGGGDLIGKEVNNEGGREVEAEDLVVRAEGFGDGFEGLDGHGEEETGGVVDLGGGNNLLGDVSLEVGRLEVVSGREVSDEGALPLLHEDGAGAGGGLLVNVVVSEHAVRGGGLLELLAKLVLPDGSHESGLAGLAHHPLGNADGVLGRAAGNVLGRVILNELVVDWHVLLLSEDGGIQLHLVLVEYLLGDGGANVEKGVADTLREGGERRGSGLDWEGNGEDHTSGFGEDGGMERKGDENVP